MQNDIVRRPVAQQDVVAAPAVAPQPSVVQQQQPAQAAVDQQTAITNDAPLAPAVEPDVPAPIATAKSTQSKPVAIIIAAIVVFCGLSGAVIYGTMQNTALDDTPTALRN